MATEIIIATGINATPIVKKICLMLTLPINISNKAVAPVSNAFERLAGIISAQIISTGVTTGRNPFLKSLIVSCFLLSNREIYINNANLARSLVCTVILIIGSLIQRLPSLIFAPNNKVYSNSGIDIKNNIVATF